jgi:hypothetical protein
MSVELSIKLSATHWELRGKDTLVVAAGELRRRAAESGRSDTGRSNSA